MVLQLELNYGIAGEDIINSEDDADADDINEPNEIVYDDFFRHDDDFGSDIENDDGLTLPTTIRKSGAISKAIVGPRYILSSPIKHEYQSEVAPTLNPSNVPITENDNKLYSLYYDIDGKLTPCPENDKDIPKLSPYFFVTYPISVECNNDIGVSEPLSPLVSTEIVVENAASIEKSKALNNEQVIIIFSFVTM